MVDVSTKSAVRRTALAEGKIYLHQDTVSKIKSFQIQKGDVLTVARIAGILSAKRTSELIPLCHSLNVDHAEITCVLEHDGVRIRGTARCTGPTGVEMEALTAVSVAALTIYDMCKAVDSSMRISDIVLLEKKKERLPVSSGGSEHP
jgi:cyclic pyranopterin phosphate synthase